MTLTKQLNKYKCCHQTAKSGVTVEATDLDDSCFNDDGVVIDKELNDFLDKLHRAVVYMDTHPEGSGGGYVCYVEVDGEASWFDELGEGEWQKTFPTP